MAPDTSSELNDLRVQLDDVTRREVAFRLQTAKDYFQTEARLRELEQRIDALNTYVHQLHLERNALQAQIQSAHRDIEAFTWMLLGKERDAEALAQLKHSVFWPLVSGAAKVPRSPERASSVPAGEFFYYLHTSPFRLYQPGTFTLRGWVIPKDGRAATAVRVALNQRTFIGRMGIEEPDVLAQHAALSARNPRPGFEVAFDLHAGRHQLALEAQLENESWQTILSTPVWCVAKPVAV